MGILRALIAGALLLSTSIWFVEAQPVSRAQSLSPEQRHLQRILARRHYWEQRLKSEQHQNYVLQQQLVSTKGKLSWQRNRLQSEQQRAAEEHIRLVTAIDADEARVSQVRAQLSATQAQYAAVHHQAAGLLRQLRLLKAKIRRELGNVKAALVQMYEMSQVSPLEAVLEAHSLTDLLKQQSFIAEIGDRDTAILQLARRQREQVYRIALVYLNKMRELKGLQEQEAIQLRLVVAATQHEDELLLQAQRLTELRQADIRRQEASIASLAAQQQQQLAALGKSEQTAAQLLTQNQQAAERVAIIIGEQTGKYPNIGGPPGILMWPLTGIITQGFGPSPYAFEPPLTYHGVYYPHFHTGIDIAAPFQSPIHAAAAGRVIFAGFMYPGHPHIGYGLCVIVMHTAHLATLYAHMDDSLGLKVHVGSVVAGGQTIGYEGLTGNTTGPHLHFEVRLNGQFVNPLNYLPAKQP